MLRVAEGFQFEYGKFMEQVSEVEPFTGLNPINALFEPINV